MLNTLYHTYYYILCIMHYTVLYTLVCPFLYNNDVSKDPVLDLLEYPQFDNKEN